jgi:hypothetical protein
MFRRPPRLILLVACLLTFATSASAECAWVLWVKVIAIDTLLVETGSTEWKTVNAASTRTDCEMNLSRALQSFAAASDAMLKPPRGTSLVSETRHYICLPDTVDPRGPKGK